MNRKTFFPVSFPWRYVHSCVKALPSPSATTSPVLCQSFGDLRPVTRIKEKVRSFAAGSVTGAVATGTYPANAVPVSISRRDHFCAALSNRLGKPDLCAQGVARPSSAQQATATIAQSVAADAFSRGSQVPVTPSDPTLFYRSASELLCSNIAAQVVDPSAGGGVYSMSDVPGAIANMVERLMGYPPAHPLHGEAIQIHLGGSRESLRT